MKYVVSILLIVSFVFFVQSVEAKPVKRDGVCETITYEGGKATSHITYPCS